MIRGAIFDVDGTLLDSMHAWDTVASDYVKANNMVPADDLDSRIRECCLRDVSIIMRDEYNIPKSLEQLDLEISDMVKYKYYNLVQLKPGVEKLVSALHEKGVRMCIASASSHDHIEEALKRCGIMQYFTKIFSCVDVGYSKRQPEIFNMALEHLGTEAAETCMVDDALYVAGTAGALGLRCVGIYDETMEDHQEALKQATECYIRDYSNLDEFWAWFENN